MPQRCWVENAMPQWNAGASRHLWIDFVITTTLTSMESVWHLAQREGSIRAARTLIKWKKKKKKDDKHSRGGKTWCNFVWSPHWPCVLSGRGPLITFKFLWAHEKTRHRFDKKWKKKKTMATQNGVKWDSDPLPFDIWWSHYATIYLVVQF